MKRPLPALILAITLPLSLPALAGEMAHMNHGGTAGHAAMADALSEGVVKKVDKAQGKLTIRHGPLENLRMPPMTMVFRVKDPAMLGQVKAGDNIRFQAEQIKGQFVVTRMEGAR